MTIYALTVTPNVVAMGLRDNVGVFNSPMAASQQTVDRGALHWYAEYSYTNVRQADRGTLLALIAKLRGRTHRIEAPVYDNQAEGAYGGTPLVSGGSQTGSTLAVDGCSINVTDWIKAGDYFSVDVNGAQELKMATADASSDGSGNITLTFEPRLRFSPLDNAAIRVQDGVLPKPAGTYLLVPQETLWSSMPARAGYRSALSLQMVEDMLAGAP